MEWYLKVMRQYSDFNGRARRKEYWMFVLFNFIFAVAALILDFLLNFGALYYLYMIATLIPGLAVAVRRMHDVGKSGWMILVAAIPFIGVIWLLVLLASDSQPGENQYGPNPKELVTEFDFEKNNDFFSTN